VKLLGVPVVVSLLVGGCSGLAPSVLVLDRRTGEVRVPTAAELGMEATWFRPQAISHGIIVGRASQAEDAGTSSPLWAFDLSSGRPLDVPRELRGFRRFVAAIASDGEVIVGVVSTDDDRGPRPFAWRLYPSHVTWLPLPANRKGGLALDVREDLVVGNSYGKDDPQNEFELHRGMRGIVCDLRSGEYLDLGIGHAALSGTMATEIDETPQTLVAATEGDRVLGFLGSGCDGNPSCGAESFGGTPIVWDISDWLALLGR
jgi:hypothetical protein